MDCRNQRKIKIYLTNPPSPNMNEFHAGIWPENAKFTEKSKVRKNMNNNKI